MAWEGAFLLWIQENLRAGWWNPVWIFITKLGDAGFLWIALSFVLLLFKKTRRAGFVALASIVFCYIINNMILKETVARTRPYEVIEGLKLLVGPAGDYSFPSGHACSSFAAACSYQRILPRRAGIAAIMLAALISFSRLYVGIHYPTDVIAGACIGIFGSLLVFWVSEKIRSARAHWKKRREYTGK